MNQSRKQLYTGIILGVLSAFLISLVIFFVSNPGLDLAEYFKIFYSGAVLTPILSVSLLGNFVLFFIFLKLNKDMVSKGILTATIGVGVFIFILKFFFS